MERFSQRIGKTPVQETIQIDTMTESFKNRLFNAIKLIVARIFYIDNFLYKYNFRFGDSLETNNYDTFIYNISQQIYRENKIYFFYDFIEFIVDCTGQYELREQNTLITEFNKIFELEKSAYRLDKNGTLIPITDEVELKELAKASKLSQKYGGVEEHLNNARAFFSNRENPNYNKTISESIDAVESLCKIIANDSNATLGSVLKEIDNLHPALEKSISKLYGYASDESGIRHANKTDKKNIDEHTAKFILVTCHSIINYLIAKYFINENPIQ